MMDTYLILDIGGTKSTSVLFSGDGTVRGDFLTVPSRTYEGADAVFENTVELAERVLQAAGCSYGDLKAIGVGAPGPLDYRTGRIIDVPMMGWKDFPLGDLLRERFGVPVYVENDGNLGALAEARVGVAKGLASVLYQTLSTGCGGGIALNGRIYHGHSGFAGEFGHVSIDMNGSPCGCGGRGCYELYASGTALNARLRNDMRKGVSSLVFEMAENKPEKLNGALLSKAAENGDEYARAMFREQGHYIGTGIANLLNLFDPDAVVLSGGLVKSYRWFENEMMMEIRRRCCFPVGEDRIRISELNDKAVAYGAFCMVADAAGEESKCL